MRRMLKRPPEPDDQGTILVVALVFLLVISLITVAVAQMAVGANANSTNARVQQKNQADFESEASLAIQSTRAVYNYSGCTSACYAASGFTSPGKNCTPGSGGISGLSVWCEGSGGSENGVSIRTVDFYVCQGSTNCAGLAGAPLYAEAVFEDLPPGEPFNADQCTTSSTNTCGLTVSLTAWDVRLADL